MNRRSWRINRNILECKLRITDGVTQTSYSINRNILECKYGKTFTLRLPFSVLIETYWNVNEVTVANVEGKVKY